MSDSVPNPGASPASAAADQAFDQQFSTLTTIEPPMVLEAQTLAAWRSERKRSELRTRVIAGLGMLAMAALTLFAVNDTPIVGAPETMVERGLGGENEAVLPAISLKISVRTQSGKAERFAANRRYDAGNTLMFRVSLPSPATIRLRREEQVLWTGQLPAGEHDLPVGYTLEAGEGPARFVIEGGAEPLTVYLPAVASP